MSHLRNPEFLRCHIRKIPNFSDVTSGKSRFANHLRIVRELFANCFRIIRELFANYLRIIRGLFANYPRFTCKLLANYLRIVCDLFANYSRIIRELFVDYSRIICELFAKYLRIMTHFTPFCFCVQLDHFAGSLAPTLAHQLSREPDENQIALVWLLGYTRQMSDFLNEHCIPQASWCNG